MSLTEEFPFLALRRTWQPVANAAELKSQAMKDGMLTMYEDGLRKAVAGTTTIEEVLRATRED